MIFGGWLTRRFASLPDPLSIGCILGLSANSPVTWNTIPSSRKTTQKSITQNRAQPGPQPRGRNNIFVNAVLVVE